MNTKNQKNKTQEIQKFTSFQNFIEFAYSLKGKKIHLKTSQVDSLLVLNDYSIDTNADFIKKDTTFAVPKELIFFTKQKGSKKGIEIALINFLYKIIEEQCLLFNIDNLLEIFRSDAPNTDKIKKAIDKISDTNITQLDSSKFSEFSDKIFKTYKFNLINTLILLYFEEQNTEWRSQQFIETMETFFKFKKPRNQYDIIRRIFDNKNIDLLIILNQNIRSSYDEKIDRANKALSDKSRLMIENEKLLTEITQQRLDFGKYKSTQSDKYLNLQAEIESLNKSIESININNKASISILRDNKETLRTDILRIIKSDSELLSIGLEALNRENPRTNVAIDAIERVIESLHRAIQKLKGE